MFSRIYMWSCLHWAFLCYEYWLLIQSPYLLSVCSALRFLPDSLLMCCVFLVIYSFLLGYVICWYIIICNRHLKFFFISKVFIVTSPLLFMILFTWLFSLFPLSGSGFVDFVYFLKRTTEYCWFSIVFLFSVWFIFVLILLFPSFIYHWALLFF